MARNSVGTRKTPDGEGAAKVRQKSSKLPQGAATKKRRAPGVSKHLSSDDKRMLDLWRCSSLSGREIGRRFGKDESYVRRLAAKQGVERGDSGEIHSRIEAEAQKQIAEETAGRPLVTADTIQKAFVTAAARVLSRQRDDQKAARNAVQTLLQRLQSMMAELPEIHDALEALAAAAMAVEDDDMRRAAYKTMQVLNVEGLSKTARQLVASLRDLDGIERAAHGIKAGEGGDNGTGGTVGARAVVVPAKQDLPADED